MHGESACRGTLKVFFSLCRARSARSLACRLATWMLMMRAVARECRTCGPGEAREVYARQDQRLRRACCTDGAPDGGRGDGGAARRNHDHHRDVGWVGRRVARRRRRGRRRGRRRRGRNAARGYALHGARVDRDGDDGEVGGGEGEGGFLWGGPLDAKAIDQPVHLRADGSTASAGRGMRGVGEGGWQEKVRGGERRTCSPLGTTTLAVILTLFSCEVSALA